MVQRKVKKFVAIYQVNIFVAIAIRYSLQYLIIKQQKLNLKKYSSLIANNCFKTIKS